MCIFFILRWKLTSTFLFFNNVPGRKHKGSSTFWRLSIPSHIKDEH
jgi:hypothetical protein